MTKTELLEAIVECVPGLAAYFDTELRVQFANARFMAMTGATRKVEIGSHLRDTLGEQAFAAAEPFARAALRGEPQRLERELTRPDGSVGLLVAHYEPHWVDGKVVGLVGFVTDVGAMRLAQLEAEQRFTKTFSSSPAALIIRRMSDDRAVEVNDQYVQMTGFSRQELIGKTTVESGFETAKGAQEREARLAAVLGPDGTLRNVEVPYKTKRGESRTAIASIQRVDFGRDGLCTLGTFFDITERKLAERRLAAQNEVSRALAEATTLADAAPRILEVLGRAEGWTVGGVWQLDGQSGKLFCELTWAANEREATAAIVEATRRLRCAVGEGGPGRVWQTRESLVIGDVRLDENFPRRGVAERAGVTSWLGFPIKHGDSMLGVIEFMGSRPQLEPQLESVLIGIGQQIGLFVERARAVELRRMSEQLTDDNRRIQEASRLKSEFLANMSHELRTPLNAVIGFTSLLRAGSAGPVSDTQREYLDDVLMSSKHLLQLINDVLDLAKIESGRIELKLVEVDVAKVVGEVRDVVRGMSAQKQLALALELDPELRTVVADERMLKQILYNYLSNAIKFTPVGGRITVRVVPESAANFRLEVEDTGIGINAGDVKRLFVEFQQLEAGADKKYQGTGLGLALAKKCAEAQGGHVGVDSEPGRGSRFFAVLPRACENALSP
jgi:PAS domain S-box-containing protein